MAIVPLHDALRNSLKEGKYSDLNLKCGDKEFKVHKVILCSYSDVFTAAMDGSFQEASTGSMIINEFDCATVQLMLDFMYAGTYESPNDDVLQHIKVNSIASCYQVQPLTDMANEKISSILQVENQGPDLFCRAFDEAFVSSTDKSLHRIMGFEAASKIEKLIESEWFSNINGIEETSLAIMQNLAARIRDLQREEIDAKFSHEAKERSFSEFLALKVKEKDEEIKRLHDGVALLKKLMKCRNTACNANFLPFLEEESYPTPHWLVRCGHCRCRHESAP